MGPKIQIRQVSSSSLAGQMKVMDKATVRLGRRPDNDIVFDPARDLLVSGKHCEVRLVDGRLYVCDVGSTNGTFVNGQRITGQVPVTSRDRIRMGEDGPEFVVSLPDEESAAMTIVGPPAPAAASLQPAPTPSVRLFAGGAGVAPGAGPAHPAPPPAPPRQAPPPKAAPPADEFLPPHLRSQQHKSHVGLNTLMGVVNEATSRERRKVMKLVVPIVLVLLVGMAVLGYILFLKPDPEKPKEWAEILRERQKSVYLVVLRTPGRDGVEEAGQGTAWSVKEGLLGTNAHVAEIFNELKEGQTLIARSNTQPPKDLSIVGVDIHPGYDAFDKEWDVYRKFIFDPESNKPMGFAKACDVAVLKIEESQKKDQMPPLELAPAEGLHGLSPGDSLAYVGFPMEGLVLQGGDVRKPVAQLYPGGLTRKTDHFFAAVDDAKDATFLHYNLVSRGGASGSPVFNRQGQVVGLIAGGHYLPTLKGQMRMNISGAAFGPRVDLLEEIIDGVAQKNLDDRLKQWRDYLKDRWDKSISGATKLAGQLAAEELVAANVKFQNLGLVNEWKQAVRGTGPANAVLLAPVPQVATGSYCIVMIADAPATLPVVGFNGAGQAQGAMTKPALHFNATGSINVTSPGTLGLEIRVGLDAKGDAGPANVRVFLFRAVPP